MGEQKSVWEGGEAYEPYVGRWSRLVGREFLSWLDLPASQQWLDVGCGTGALTRMILAYADPKEVVGIDPSSGYVVQAKKEVRDGRARFKVGDAVQIPEEDASFDAVVSGLVLNFISDVEVGMKEMLRVTRPGGTVAGYVWDYAGKIELMRYFWDAAVELRPEDRRFDEGVRFPLCNPKPLSDLFNKAGLKDIEVRAIDVPTYFQDFDDYWSPFLSGQCPAPDYAMSLNEEDRVSLRERIREKLPFEEDGSIQLIGRAWSVKGHRRSH